MKTKIEHHVHGYFVYGLDKDKAWQLIGVFEDEEIARQKAKEASLNPDEFKTLYYKDGQEITCED